MKLKPVLYLRNLSQATSRQLEKLSQMGFPVVVEESEFQICSRNPELFSGFPQGQVQTFLREGSEWKPLVDLALKNEWTHFLVVSQYHSEFLEALSEKALKLVNHPFDFVFFNEPQAEKQKNSLLLQR